MTRKPSMVVLVLALGVVLGVVAACWRSSPAPQPPVANQTAAPPLDAAPRRHTPTANEQMALVMEQFTDRMCTCTDSQCAIEVSDDMTRWSEEHSSQQEAPPKLTDEEIERFAALGERLGSCMQSAMSGSAAGSATP